MPSSKSLKNNVNITHKDSYDPPMHLSSAPDGHFFDALLKLFISR